MSERRSGRSRKQVNYSKFTTENDDDFADPSPPPPKKKKMEKPEGQKDKVKSSVVKSSEKPAGRKGSQRLPLEEKLYERDLKTALEMSLQASQEDQEDDSSCNLFSSRALLHSTPVVDWDQALPSKTDLPADSQCIMPSAIPHVVAPDNDIEFLGTVTDSDSDSPPTKRRAATKKRKSYVIDDDKSTDDENFSDAGSESDSESNEADSDFDEGKGKSRKKGKVHSKATHAKAKTTNAGKKNQSAAKTNNKASAGPSSATPKTPAASQAGQGRVTGGVTSMGKITSSSSSSVTPSRRGTSGLHKTPAWTPPGRVDDSSSSSNSSSGVSHKSPSSGLRLGLSRHARTKPLHPSLKVS